MSTPPPASMSTTDPEAALDEAAAAAAEPSDPPPAQDTDEDEGAAADGVEPSVPPPDEAEEPASAPPVERPRSSTIKRTASSQVEDRLSRAFQKIDDDGSGEISKEEFISNFKVLNDEITKAKFGMDTCQGATVVPKTTDGCQCYQCCCYGLGVYFRYPQCVGCSNQGECCCTQGTAFCTQDSTATSCFKCDSCDFVCCEKGRNCCFFSTKAQSCCCMTCGYTYITDQCLRAPSTCCNCDGHMCCFTFGTHFPCNEDHPMWIAVGPATLVGGPKDTTGTGEGLMGAHDMER